MAHRQASLERDKEKQRSRCKESGTEMMASTILNSLTIQLQFKLFNKYLSA